MVKGYHLFLDVETTGTIPGTHALIEAAAILYQNGEEVDYYHFKQQVPNGRKVDVDALKYNGVTINDLNDKGRMIPDKNYPEGDVPAHFGGFVDFLINLPKGTTIGGHNFEFDLNFIKAELELYGMEGLDNILGFDRVDTKFLATCLKEANVLDLEKTSLHNIAEALGVKFHIAHLHAALYDAQLTAKVYFALVELLSQLKVNNG